MVIIKPFRTTILNQSIIDCDKLICPVYDTIDKTEYARYGNEKNSIVHITVNNNTVNNKDFITGARKNLYRLYDESILKECKHPALYIYGIRYSLSEDILKHIPDRAKQNIFFAFGLVALVKIEAPGNGNIVGHEKIFEKNTQERYELMKACNMNFAPIVSEYSMPGHEINNILEEYLGFKRPDLILRDDRPPLVDLTLNNTRHILWEITESAIIQQIQGLMADRRLLILDGHHRYNAAYKLNQADGVEYTMMMLMEGKDHALILLPWHRSMKCRDRGMLKTQIDQFFEVIWKGEPVDELCEILNMKDDEYDIKIGIYDGNQFYVMKAHRDEVMRLSDMLDEKVGLDYISLNEWIIKPCTKGNKGDNVNFINSIVEATRKVDEQGFDVAFLMRPLTVADVEYKAHEEKKNFPQKSTLFLPKVAEGIMAWRISGVNL